MENRYRVKTSFSRLDREELKVRRCFYLSVEGNRTEKVYFEELNSHKAELGIKASVHVDVLRRRHDDNDCLPSDVIELLDEFVNIHNGEIDPEELDLPSSISKKYSIEELRDFLNGGNGLSPERGHELELMLSTCPIGICYRNFKEDYDPEKDVFAVIIDRDKDTHSPDMIRACIDECVKKGYEFYISNPCFEFWLLMHKADIRAEYGDSLDEIKENKKVSNKHSFVSSLLTKKAKHGKSFIKFEENYLPYVDRAIEQSREFETDKFKLIDEIGTNIADLIEEMRK